MRVYSIGTIGLIAYQRMQNKTADKLALRRDASSPSEATKTPAEVLRDRAECVSIDISAEARMLSRGIR